MINTLKDILHKIDSYFRLPVGTYIYVKKCEKFPEGTLGKIISYNSPQREYHITTKAQSEFGHTNPVYLENEDGFQVLKEEFEHGEFVKYKDAYKIDLENKGLLRRGIEFTGNVMILLGIVGLGLLTYVRFI